MATKHMAAGPAGLGLATSMGIGRLASIDLLRGVVIVLMALDHTRDFFGPAPFNAEDLSATTPAWFMTRWITHLCATVFVFLAGTSAWLRGAKGGATASAAAPSALTAASARANLPALSRYLLSRYLLSRGAMLLVLELTWINFSWQFGYNVTVFQVIWTLGMGMITLSGLIWLPRWAIITFAVTLIAGHNLLDDWKPGGLLWMVLHQGGFYRLTDTIGIFVLYPLIPWLGVMAAGYAAGPWFRLPAPQRQRTLLASALGLLLVFIALRSGNVYGDPAPWSAQGKGWLMDALSFLRVSKYPPSLQYLCITGALGLAMLALLERVRATLPLLRPILVFGRSPLFFYSIHIAMIHFLAGAYFKLVYGAIPGFDQRDWKAPSGYTPSLLTVYVAWVAMLALLYGLTVLWQRRGKTARAPLTQAAAG